MKSFDTDIKKYSEKTHLKASERRELRDRLFAYMEYHPLATVSPSIDEVMPKSTLFSEPYRILHFTHMHLRVAGGVFALCAILTPFIAERSVPGDVLYLVKTGVNENVQAQLVSSPYEKIQFETKLMERRIAEARELASEGKLTDDVKTQLAENVKEHTDAVKQGIAELRTTDADSAAIATITFNSSLEVQSAVLDAESEASDTALEGIITVVQDAQNEIASNQDESKPSYDTLAAQVERETTRAYELFTTVKKSATPEEINDINRRLSDIDRLTAEAKGEHETNPDISVEDLSNTLGLIQKLITFMTNIDVRETVALQNLVPVVLSDEERLTAVKGEIDVLHTLKDEVEGRLTLITDESVLEKVRGGLADVTSNLDKASVAVQVPDVAVAESLSHEARNIMTDLDVLTQEKLPSDVSSSTATTTEAVTNPEDTGSTTPNEATGTSTEARDAE